MRGMFLLPASERQSAAESLPGEPIVVAQWGHAPSPLRGWGYPHPLAGERANRVSSSVLAHRRPS
jgi:hypothetical protein